MKVPKIDKDFIQKKQLDENVKKLLSLWSEVRDIVDAVEMDMYRYTTKNRKDSGKNIREGVRIVNKVSNEILELILKMESPNEKGKKDTLMSEDISNIYEEIMSFKNEENEKKEEEKEKSSS